MSGAICIRQVHVWNENSVLASLPYTLDRLGVMVSPSLSEIARRRKWQHAVNDNLVTR